MLDTPGQASLLSVLGKYQEATECCQFPGPCTSSYVGYNNTGNSELSADKLLTYVPLDDARLHILTAPGQLLATSVMCALFFVLLGMNIITAPW